MSENMIVMYGCPPDNEPRIPAIGDPFPWPLPPNPTTEPFALPFAPRVLTPCPACKRHISTPECPFCFADSRDQRLVTALRERDESRAEIAALKGKLFALSTVTRDAFRAIVTEATVVDLGGNEAPPDVASTFERLAWLDARLAMLTPEARFVFDINRGPRGVWYLLRGAP